ncbi:sensor histidine kinase [Nonomuraea sp. NPDC049480]|uniref:sensor histidine kinase n=1 Tax=Nonomuraea sp. NPDC049480 TaxID=3364353 RepID=UPI0037B26702
MTALATGGDLLVWSQSVHLIGDAPVALAVYSAGRYATWPRSGLGLLAAEAWVAGVLALGDLEEPADAFGAAPIIAGAWALGLTIRLRLRDVVRLRAVTERLRMEQAANARRAVHDERDRIGRELHDTVSHDLTAIAVQAHAARFAPEQATRSLERIAGSAAAALEEMRLLLGAIGAPEPSPPTLNDLEGLLADARLAGLTVSAEVADGLPEAVQISCYRIIQSR